MASFDDRELRAYERVTDLFGDVDPAVRIGAGGWTARDVLAHLCNVARRYTSVPRLAETVQEVEAINAEELGALDGLGIGELLGKFERAFARYRETWMPMGPEHQWPFHGGGTLSTAALRTNWLGELLVHGYDVAAAAGAEWSIDTADASDLLDFMREIVPSYVGIGEPTTVAVAADGTEPWLIDSDRDRAVVTAGAGTADAVIAGPPDVVILFLYQRLDIAAAQAAGLRIGGDRGALERFLDRLQKP